MSETTMQELNEKFAPANKELEPDVLSELQSIMRMHSLSAQDLFFKWESYSMKMELESDNLTLDKVRALKQDIQDGLERANRSHTTHIKPERKPGATPRNTIKNGGDVYGMLDSLVPSTPASGKHNKSATKKRPYETPSITRVKNNIPSSSPDHKSPVRLEDQLNSMNAVPVAAFNDRPNAGEVIEVLNDHLGAPDPPIAPFGESRVKLTAASDQKKLGYKPLAMKSSEASEILDDRIDEFLVLVQDHHNIDYSEFGSAASQSTNPIVAVGRIASDSSEGKLNKASLVLETSRRTGGGLRVPLNVDGLKDFQFFPGQIVAFRGVNTSGKDFVVDEVLEIPLLPNAATTPAALDAHKERLRGGPDAMDSDDEPAPLCVLFASGPYTTDDNLDFEALHALCSEAADTYADALILTGPFIDVDHPLIATGDFELPDDAVIDPDVATMSTVFKYMISPALNRLVSSNPHITIVLIPSVKDIIDKHVSWPQDPFPRKELGLPKTARVIGNPMTFSINEMLLGISSQDILYELRHEELIGVRPTEPQLLSRLCKYLIEQRHYFPIFPPVDRSRLPKTGTAETTPVGVLLDTSYLKLGEMVNVRPDVMVIPSSLPPFAKVIDSVLVINPGFLSKRRGAGTYARLSLYPPKFTTEELGSNVMVSHRIFDRARVEITRI